MSTSERLERLISLSSGAPTSKAVDAAVVVPGERVRLRALPELDPIEDAGAEPVSTPRCECTPRGDEEEAVVLGRDAKVDMIDFRAEEPQIAATTRVGLETAGCFGRARSASSARGRMSRQWPRRFVDRPSACRSPSQAPAM